MLAFGLWMSAGGAIGVFGGCEEGLRESSSGTVTATITLGQAHTIEVDSAVAVVLHVERGRTDGFATLDATVTASTSSAAAARLADLTIEVESSNPDVVHVQVRGFEDALLGGKLTIALPLVLSTSVVGRGGTVDAIGIDGNVDVIALGHVRVVDPRGNVTVGVKSGNALVSKDLLPGSSVRVEASAGDIELTLQEPLVSADIQASVGANSNGFIAISHPDLPQPLTTNAKSYRATTGGGLASAVLTAQDGRIVIRSR